MFSLRTNLSKSEKEANSIAVWYCLFIFILHPGWAIGIKVFLPDQYNDLVGRSVIGIAFLGLLGASFLSKWVKQNLSRISQVGYIIFAVHWFWMVSESKMDPVYIIGSVIVSTAFTLAYNRVKSLLVYAVTMIFLASVTAFTSDAFFGYKFMLTAGVLTAMGVGVSLVAARSKILLNLEQSEIRERQLTQQIIEKELLAAKMIQQNLLAPVSGSPYFALEAYYKSAGETGGDWYGHYLDKSGNILYLWVGDVTGHGLPSAMVTAVTCGALYACEKRVELLSQYESPKERLIHTANVLNEVIHENGGSLIMTMLFCAFDMTNGKLVVANAGHLPPLIRSMDGAIKQLRCSGAPLGFDRNASWEASEFDLKKGDSMLIYTDGLIENHAPELPPLSKKSLRNILANSPPDESLISLVVADAQKHWGSQLDDDVTILTLQWLKEKTTKSKVA